MYIRVVWSLIKTKYYLNRYFMSNLVKEDNEKKP